MSNPPSPDSSPTHSPRSSCADLGLHANEREDDTLLKTLLQEVRGTKQELKSEISVFYQTVERRLAQTEEKMNSILALLPFNAGGSSASPARTTTTSPSPQILSASMRADLTRQLPFLSDFNVESTSVPFVVDDLRCDCSFTSTPTPAFFHTFDRGHPVSSTASPFSLSGSLRPRGWRICSRQRLYGQTTASAPS